MNCSHCNTNPATVHFKSVINGVTTEVHFCGACAQDKGLLFVDGQGFPLSPAPFESLTEMIAQLANESVPLGEKQPDIRCARCGLAYSEFQRTGRFGCDDCYASFAPAMSTLLGRIHGHSRHTGKAPLARGSGEETGGKYEREALERQLKDAVVREEFEKAAQLRDKIRRLKNG
jgi:protein arginine kinase activator